MHDCKNAETTSVTKATFNRASEQTIREATAICSQRGSEYLDSWSLESLSTPWLDNLLRDYPTGQVPSKFIRHHRRLIVMASMLDIKLSRLGGPYKSDTALDTINYVGAYNTLRLEYDKAVQDYAQQPKSLEKSFQSSGPNSVEDYFQSRRPVPHTAGS